MYSSSNRNTAFIQLLGISSCRTFSTNSLSENNIKPVVVYSNADTQKLDLLQMNKNKSGIYHWVNKETRNSYVGYAMNLS